MCYASPGPRCSSHARQELREARIDYSKALLGSSSDAELNMYQDTKKRAQEDYNRTPEGIRKLRAEGKDDLADAYAAERQQSIQRYRASQSARADQEMWNGIEDIKPMTMVVHDNKVKVVEDVKAKDVNGRSHHDVEFTDGTRERYDSNAQVLLATPDGKRPLRRRDLPHQEAYEAAVAKLGGNAPTGDRVIVYARNAEGREIAASLRGSRARSKDSWEDAVNISRQIDDQLGDGAEIRVMSTDPDGTLNKSRAVNKFLSTIDDRCRTNTASAESFHDRYAR